MVSLYFLQREKKKISITAIEWNKFDDIIITAIKKDNS